jgi:hypothetical protein
VFRIYPGGEGFPSPPFFLSNHLNLLVFDKRQKAGQNCGKPQLF